MQIEPERIYTESDVITELKLSFGDLSRGRADGLQCRQIRRGKRYYQGQWIIDWLTRSEEGKANDDDNRAGRA